MPKKMALSVLIVLALAVIIALLKNEKVETAKGVSGATPVAQSSNVDSRAPQSSGAAAPTPDLGGTAAKVDPRFQQWVREEAKTMDSPLDAGANKEAQIREVVAKLTPEQAQHLQQILMTPSSLPREKILSAYLLVEGGEKTHPQLKASIAAPLTEKGGDSHSEAEHKGIREKSLRIMMIDGLFAQAKTNASARATLVRAIADSGDAYIKAYGQQRLDQLSASSRQ